MCRMIVALTTISLCLITMVDIGLGSANKMSIPGPTIIDQSTETLHSKEIGLLKKYRINLTYQTAFNSKNQMLINDKKMTPTIKKALYKAMTYWNDELKTKVFKTVTVSKATATVRWTTKKSKLYNVLAWWSPKNKILKLQKDKYKHELKDITKYMKRHYQNDPNPVISKKVAYANITDFVAKRARTVEYARIITHELGHSLGLCHSTNSLDIMYPGLGFGDIYDFEKVSDNMIWKNPLTSTDFSRGRLAYRLEKIK